MSLPKVKSREAVLHVLYSWEVSGTQDTVLIQLLMEQLKTTKKNIKDVWDVALGIWGKKKEMDQCICDISDQYDLDRISKVDLSILRLSIYEMLFDDKISRSIIIAEGVRLSCKFSSPEAANFVQAMLNKVKIHDASVC